MDDGTIIDYLGTIGPLHRPVWTDSFVPADDRLLDVWTEVTGTISTSLLADDAEWARVVAAYERVNSDLGPPMIVINFSPCHNTHGKLHGLHMTRGEDDLATWRPFWDYEELFYQRLFVLASMLPEEANVRFDLDWEFPTQKPEIAGDRLSVLVETIRSVFPSPSIRWYRRHHVDEGPGCLEWREKSAVPDGVAGDLAINVEHFTPWEPEDCFRKIRRAHETHPDWPITVTLSLGCGEVPRIGAVYGSKDWAMPTHPHWRGYPLGCDWVLGQMLFVRRVPTQIQKFKYVGIQSIDSIRLEPEPSRNEALWPHVLMFFAGAKGLDNVAESLAEET
jgi:hypothetical protein